MRYFNLEVPLMRSGIMLEATNEQVGIWLRLIAYCCDQENKGMIVGCNLWNERQWVMAVGVSKEDILNPSPLWEYRDSLPAVLVVHMYPGKREQEEQMKRAAGKKGGSSTSQAKRDAARRNGLNPKGVTEAKQKPTERKGKEYKIVPFDDAELSAPADPWPEANK